MADTREERPSDAEVEQVVHFLEVCPSCSGADVVRRLLARTKRMEMLAENGERRLREAIMHQGEFLDERLKWIERAEAAEKRVAELTSMLKTLPRVEDVARIAELEAQLKAVDDKAERYGAALKNCHRLVAELQADADHCNTCGADNEARTVCHLRRENDQLRAQLAKLEQQIGEKEGK